MKMIVQLNQNIAEKYPKECKSISKKFGVVVNDLISLNANYSFNIDDFSKINETLKEIAAVSKEASIDFDQEDMHNTIKQLTMSANQFCDILESLLKIRDNIKGCE